MAAQSIKYRPLFSKIYESRKVILDILKNKRGFDVSQYEEEGVTEIRSMLENKQLDMLIENKNTKKKIYVKYCIDQNRVKASHIYDYIEDLFEIDNTLTNEDELIIITKDSLNDTLKNLLKQIYINDKKFVNVYDINSYLFNILDHEMVPEHIVLSEEEKGEVFKKYYITNKKELPEISRFDPVALAIGLRPSQMVKIIRSSPTAITSIYYRICH